MDSEAPSSSSCGGSGLLINTKATKKKKNGIFQPEVGVLLAAQRESNLAKEGNVPAVKKKEKRVCERVHQPHMRNQPPDLSASSPRSIFDVAACELWMVLIENNSVQQQHRCTAAKSHE